MFVATTAVVLGDAVKSDLVWAYNHVVDSDAADILLALDGTPHVSGVYAFQHAPADWPRLFIALDEDSPYASAK